MQWKRNWVKHANSTVRLRKKWRGRMGSRAIFRSTNINPQNKTAARGRDTDTSGWVQGTRLPPVVMPTTSSARAETRVNDPKKSNRVIRARQLVCVGRPFDRIVSSWNQIMSKETSVKGTWARKAIFQFQVSLM